MKLDPLHERLLADVLDLGSPYPLVLTGGYAVQAHGLVERLSATSTSPPRTPPRWTRSSQTSRQASLLAAGGPRLSRPTL